MKMKAKALAVAVAGGLFLGATSVAQAGQLDGNPLDPNPEGSSPSLDLDEKLLISVLEQVASVAAAFAEHQACSGSETLSVSTLTAARSASSTWDDWTANAQTFTDNPSGTRINTTSGVGEVGNTAVANLAGQFTFSNDGEIMYGDAIFDIGADTYDEHVVKDIFIADVSPGGPDPVPNEQRVVLDRGIEVITKQRVAFPGLPESTSNPLIGYPRSKWRQTSRFVEPNSGLGLISFRKVRIAPNGAPVCFIAIDVGLDRDAAGFDGFGGSLSFVNMLN